MTNKQYMAEFHNFSLLGLMTEMQLTLCSLNYFCEFKQFSTNYSPRKFSEFKSSHYKAEA